MMLLLELANLSDLLRVITFLKRELNDIIIVFRKQNNVFFELGSILLTTKVNKLKGKLCLFSMDGRESLQWINEIRIYDPLVSSLFVFVEFPSYMNFEVINKENIRVHVLETEKVDNLIFFAIKRRMPIFLYENKIYVKLINFEDVSSPLGKVFVYGKIKEINSDAKYFLVDADGNLTATRGIDRVSPFTPIIRLREDILVGGYSES